MRTDTRPQDDPGAPDTAPMLVELLSLDPPRGLRV
jgi:hypothetical protein